jgi:hypothetical protein
MSYRTSQFKRGEEEEVRIVRECHVIFGIAFKDAKLNNRWRIDWTTVGRCYSDRISLTKMKQKGKCIFVHFAPEPQALARSGCWMTFNWYSNFLPSTVIRCDVLHVSRFDETDAMLYREKVRKKRIF